MTEAQFQRSVIELAQINGWRVFHARKAQNGKGAWRTPVAADGAGFPDLVLVKDGRLVFAELKTDTGRLRPEQKQWLDELSLVGIDSAGCHECGGAQSFYDTVIWRPKDWDDILATLNTRNTSPF